jgi:hypothetical protein
MSFLLHSCDSHGQDEVQPGVFSAIGSVDATDGTGPTILHDRSRSVLLRTNLHIRLAGAESPGVTEQ